MRHAGLADEKESGRPELGALSSPVVKLHPPDRGPRALTLGPHPSSAAALYPGFPAVANFAGRQPLATTRRSDFRGSCWAGWSPDNGGAKSVEDPCAPRPKGQRFCACCICTHETPGCPDPQQRNIREPLTDILLGGGSGTRTTGVLGPGVFTPATGRDCALQGDARAPADLRAAVDRPNGQKNAIHTTRWRRISVIVPPWMLSIGPGAWPGWPYVF